MLSNRKMHLAASAAALFLTSGIASAGQVIHFSQDFTDNSIADEVGHIANANVALGLRTQQSWRNPSQTYYGPSTATAFDAAPGTWGNNFELQLAGTATLQSGNVWVVDMSMISDVATLGGQFFNSAPGPVLEGSWNGGTSSLLAALKPAIGNSEGMVLAAAYPSGSDSNPEPTTLGTSLSDASLPTKLNGVLRSKYAYHAISGGFTRVSTQVLNGNTPAGSAGHNDGAAGTFRSDYTGGMSVQIPNGHGSGNVTYSAGAGGGADVAYNAARTDLELGLTHLTFKQVSAADNTTDGQVNLSDAANTVANWNPGGSGRDFFQGDTNGDTKVDLTDAGTLVAAWTATPDNLAVGTGAARYEPSNGHVFLEVNGVAIWQLNSATGQFTGQPNDLNPGAGVRWTINGTTKQADAFTIGEFIGSNSINFDNVFNGDTFEFDYTGVPGDLGQLLPAGLTNLSGLTLTYNTLGGQPVTVAVTPEPAGLAVLALTGTLLAARRRRTA